MTDQIDFDNFNPNEWEPGEKLTPLEAIRIMTEGGIVFEGRENGIIHRMEDGYSQFRSTSVVGSPKWLTVSINTGNLYRAVRKRVPLTPEEAGKAVEIHRATGHKLGLMADGQDVALCFKKKGTLDYIPLNPEYPVYATPKPQPKPRRKLPLADALKWMVENPGKVMWTKGGTVYRWDSVPGRLVFRDNGSDAWALSFSVDIPAFYLDPPEGEK